MVVGLYFVDGFGCSDWEVGAVQTGVMANI